MKMGISLAKVMTNGLKRSKMDHRGIFRNVLALHICSKVHLKFSLK